jgi:hypothetical protein
MGELLHDEEARRSFIDSAIYHEGHFHEIGYNHHSGKSHLHPIPPPPHLLPLLFPLRRPRGSGVLFFAQSPIKTRAC